MRLGHARSLLNNEDQDGKRQSLRRELGRGGGCYMILGFSMFRAMTETVIMPVRLVKRFVETLSLAA
jgi:hypothetical protein